MLQPECVVCRACFLSMSFSTEPAPESAEKPAGARCAGQFRAQVAHLSVKEPAQPPRQLKGKPLGTSIAAGEVPTLAQLGLQPVTRIPGTSHVRGGADTYC